MSQVETRYWEHRRGQFRHVTCRLYWNGMAVPHGLGCTAMVFPGQWKRFFMSCRCRWQLYMSPGVETC